MRFVGRILNPITDAGLGMHSPQRLWDLFCTKPDGAYLKQRLWAYFLKNESQLPDGIRAAFANHKWNSEWFFDAWFNKPLSLDHVEARFRLVRQLRQSELHFDAIDDLGTANGTFLRDCTNAFPGLRGYRGWEISQKAVDALQAKYGDDPSLSFYRTNIKDLVAAPYRPVLTTSGTFQYMAEAELAQFLRDYAPRPNAMIAISEISQLGLDGGASQYRAYETYSHDYPGMLASAGFKVLAQEAFAFPGKPTWVICLAARRVAVRDVISQTDHEGQAQA